MLLARFLQYFGRVSPNNPKETRIEFRSSYEGDTDTFAITNVTFDIDENKWIVELRKNVF